MVTAYQQVVRQCPKKRILSYILWATIKLSKLTYILHKEGIRKYRTMYETQIDSKPTSHVVFSAKLQLYLEASINYFTNKKNHLVYINIATKLYTLNTSQLIKNVLVNVENIFIRTTHIRINSLESRWEHKYKFQENIVLITGVL